MKQIKCDRCGAVETAEPMMKGYDVPIIKITRAESIFSAINPREVDLCNDCRRQLAGWLKPLNLNEEACATIREKYFDDIQKIKDELKDDMKAAEDLRNCYRGIVKNLAEDGCALGPKPQRPPKMSVEHCYGPEKEMQLSLLLLIFGGHGHGEE